METVEHLLALRSQGRSEIDPWRRGIQPRRSPSYAVSGRKYIQPGLPLCGLDGVFQDADESGAGTVCQTTTRGEKRVR